MIKSLRKYDRPDGWLSRYARDYWNVEFEDDQSYYNAVSYMREQHGRAGSHREIAPTWVHDPNTFTIGIRWNGDTMDLLQNCYNWVEFTMWIDSKRANDMKTVLEIHTWCRDRNHFYSIGGNGYRTLNVMAPTEKDLLMARLRFSDLRVPEPVF